MLAAIMYSGNTSSLEIYIYLIILSYLDIQRRITLEAIPPRWSIIGQLTKDRSLRI